MRIDLLDGLSTINRKKLRVAAACVLSIALVVLVVMDRHEAARSALRTQCAADAAIGAPHVLAWQTDSRPLADTLQLYIDDPAQLGFSPAGKKMLQRLATHTRLWASF